MNVFELQSIEFQYPHSTHLVTTGNLQLLTRKGILIDGPNGSGKTTLLKLLAGLLNPKRGQILFNSQPVSRVNRHQTPLVYVHAQPYIFRGTVFENLEFALFWARVPAMQHARRIQETLDMFGLGKLAYRRHYELSTGERRKVALGRAFVVNPTVVLFDEPSLGLDARSRGELVGYLHALREHNIGLVVTTHDPELKAALCLQTYTLHLTEELGGLRKGTLYENTRAS